MALRVVSLCSYLAAAQYPPGRNAFEAGAFIKAVKGKTLKGYAWLSVPGRKTKVKLTDENKLLAYRIFGRRALEHLEENVELPVVLVPVPNSSATVGSKGRPRTVLLTNALSTECGPDKASVLDALRWQDNIGATHSGGGSRNARTLYGLLRLIAAPPHGSTVVLVDDVMTTGGHLRAAAAFLRRRCGAAVPLALCAGSTIHEDSVPEDCLAVVVQDLEDFGP